MVCSLDQLLRQDSFTRKKYNLWHFFIDTRTVEEVRRFMEPVPHVEHVARATVINVHV